MAVRVVAQNFATSVRQLNSVATAMDAISMTPDVLLCSEIGAGTTAAACRGWRMVQQPRSGGSKGGGVAIAAGDRARVTKISSGGVGRVGADGGAEWLFAAVQLPVGVRFAACALYLPPRGNAFTDEHAMKFANDCVHVCAAPGTVLVIGGDFNCEFRPGRERCGDAGRRERLECITAIMQRAGVMWRRVSSDDVTRQGSLRSGGSCIDAIFIASRLPTMAVPNGTFDMAVGDHIAVAATIEMRLSHVQNNSTGVTGGAVRWAKLCEDASRASRFAKCVEAEMHKRLNLSPRAEKEALSVAQRRWAKVVAEARLDELPDIAETTEILNRAGRECLGVASARTIDAKRVMPPFWTEAVEAASRCVKKSARLLARRRRITVPDVASTEAARIALRQCRAAFENAMFVARKAWLDTRTAELRPENSEHVRCAFKTLRKLAGGRRDGCAHDAKTMCDAWRNVFGGPSNPAAANPEFLANEAEALRREASAAPRWKCTADDVDAAVRKAKRHKAVGVDALPNEALKVLVSRSVVFGVLARRFEEIVNDPSKIPSSWREAAVAMLPKSDNPSPLDYRPISLLCHLAKLCESVVWRSLTASGVAEEVLPFEQCGFRDRRGTPEATFVLESLAAEQCNNGKPLHVVLLDIKKAYDSAPFDVIAYAVRRKAIIDRRVGYFMSQWVRGHTKRLLVGGGDEQSVAGDVLQVTRGVPQGSILAPFLFGLVMDTLTARLRGEAVLGLEAIQTKLPQTRFGDFSINHILYADDTAVFDVFQSGVSKLLDVCHEWSLAAGFEFAPKKCEALRLGAVPKNAAVSAKALSLGGERVMYKDAAKHLGTWVAASERGKPVVGAQSVPSSAARVDKAFAANNTVRRFLNPARHHCVVRMGALVARLCTDGRVYFGAELQPIDFALARSALGDSAKAALGLPKASRSTSALDFVGWPTPQVVAARRRVEFLYRVYTERGDAWPQLRELVAMRLGHESDEWRETLSTWLRDALGAVATPGVAVVTRKQYCTRKRKMIDVPCSVGVPRLTSEWRDWLELSRRDRFNWINAIRTLLPPRNPHPALWDAEENAHIVYRFQSAGLVPYEAAEPWTGVGVPTSRKGLQQCPLCGGHSDCGVDLLLWCSDATVRGIVDTVVDTRAAKRAALGAISTPKEAFEAVVEVIRPYARRWAIVADVCSKVWRHYCARRK